MEFSWTRATDVQGRIDAEFYGQEFVEASHRLGAHVKTESFRNLWAEYSRIYIGIAGFEEVPDTTLFTPYLRPVDITDDGFIDYDHLPWCKREWLHDYEKNGCAQVGDLIVEVKGNTRRAAVVSNRIPPKCIVSGSSYRIKLKDFYDAHFVQAFLQSETGQKLKRRLTSNTTISYIDPASFREYRVPVPNIEIQTAIGNKIRKAERLRELASLWSQRINDLVSGILGQPKTDGMDQRSYWVPGLDLSPRRINPIEYHPILLQAERELFQHFGGVRLQEALVSPNDISNGATPDGARYTSEGIAFLRVQNILPNRLDLSDVVYIDGVTDQELQRSRLRSNDIILTITGYPGTACCVREVDLPLNTNQHSVRFHLKDDWNPFFVAAFLNSPWGRFQVQRRAIGGTREALDYPSVQSLVIPFIDRSIQDEIGTLSSDFATFHDGLSSLTAQAKSDVEALITGTLDQAQLLREGEEIARWLDANQRAHDMIKGATLCQ